MRHRDLVPVGERVGRTAAGRVMELGVGSGLNLGLSGTCTVRVKVLSTDDKEAIRRRISRWKKDRAAG
jgi:hypothetical protein